MSETSHIEFEVPDEIRTHLEQNWDNLSQRALEALAAEGYRSGILTPGQVQQMLNLRSRWETDAFLKEHRCYLDYDEKDLEQDIKSIRRVSDQ